MLARLTFEDVFAMSPRQPLLTRHRLLRVTGLIILLLLVWHISAYPRGMITAWLDHTCGHYEIQAYGSPPPFWYREYTNLVNLRYNIEINEVGSCCVSQDVADFADGYNAVSRPWIVARFGKDVFAECEKDARIK